MGNLRNVFANGAKSIFKAVGDIAVTATYISNVTGEYNPTTDVTSISKNQYPVVVIFLSDRRNRDKADDNQPVNKKVLLLASDISFEPKMEDRIIIAFQEYIIGPVEIDPAGAVWTLELLQP